MTVSIPPIISVDDHVIEPPDLWQRWLPIRFREAGPRVILGAYEMVPGGEIDRAARSGWNAFRPAAEGPETDWLLSGNLARYPHLRLAFSESQIGWMPFLWERLDNLWRKHNYADDWNPMIVEPPSHYVRGHIWGCFFEDEFGLRSRYDIGVDVITFECDYPHQDSTWPNTLAYAEKILGDLPEEEVGKIVRSNAIDLFGLEPELAGPADL